MKIAIDFDGTVVDKDYSDEYLDKEAFFQFVEKSKKEGHTVHIVTARNEIAKKYIQKYSGLSLEDIFCAGSDENKIYILNKENYDVLIDDKQELIDTVKIKFKFNIESTSWQRLLFLFYTKKPFSPGPVPQKINIDINYSHRSVDFYKLYETTSQLVREELKTDMKLLFIQGSGTAAIETAISSLNADGKIVILTNGTFSDRLRQICEKYFLDVILTNNINDVQSLLEEEKPSAFAFVQFETSKSIFNDIPNKVLEYCRNNNIVTIADCVSSLGFYDMPDVDVICSSSAKILSGCPVMGLLFYRNRDIFSENTKSFYFDINRYIENAKNKQTPHTSLIPQLITLKQNILCRVSKQQIIKNCEQIKTSSINIINEKICPVITVETGKIKEIFKWFKVFNIEPYFNSNYMSGYFQLSMFSYMDLSLYRFINTIMEVC